MDIRKREQGYSRETRPDNDRRARQMMVKSAGRVRDVRPRERE